ncbi:MAG: alanine--tRNA ligase-related protein [Halobacteriales archaeon]
MAADSPVNLAAANPYVTTFDATVGSVDGRDVSLDRTHFYAEGGGQPADTGTIGGVAVTDVQKRDGVTVHTLETAPPFEAGETVTGRVDETFRTYAMRAHTASHVVYGAGRELLADHGYGGFDIREERIRLDFATSSDVETVNPLTVQRMANEIVWEGRSVEWYEMDAATAEADDEIVFNLRDEPDPSDAVRIVEIEDWDISACGGTHVRNTTEIGPITVLDVSNPGADLVRVEFAVGPAAIRRTVDERRSAIRAAKTLDTSVDDLPQQAERLRTEAESLRDELAELGDTLLDARLAALRKETHTNDGEEWLVGAVEGVGPNAVSDRIAGLAGGADVIALAGEDGSTFVVVGTDGDTDAAEVVTDVTDEFGGGGGGRPVLAQGGGMDADPETVVDYLREETRDASDPDGS